MSNQEIIDKAYQKALDGGYLAPNGIAISPPQFMELVKLKMFAVALWGDEKITLDATHALWGKEYKSVKSIQHDFKQRAWQHHLQQMVIADDPIKYLGDNI